MKIKKYHENNKANKQERDLNLLHKHAKNTINAISIWKILSIFFIINLIIINLVNYWQPINHSELKTTYEQQQNAIWSAYKLQHYINEFKSNPDQNAFNIIQQAVSLSVDINKIKSTNNNANIENSKNLNTHIEKIVAGIPSIKLYHSNVDKTYKMIQNLKYNLVSDFQGRKGELNRNLFATADKIDNLVQKLKFDRWVSIDLINNYQKNVEDIGLEIEQYSNQIDAHNLGKQYESIINVLSEIFNDLNTLMPEVFNLGEIATEFDAVQQYQNAIITEFKQQKINYIENIDDKTLIIMTILITNLILLLIIIFAKSSLQIRKIYNNLKDRKEIYYLSHVKEEENINNSAISAMNYKVIQAKNTTNITNDNIIHNQEIISNINSIQQQIRQDTHVLQQVAIELEKNEDLANFPKQQLNVINSNVQKILDNVKLLESSICQIKFDNASHTEEKLEKAV
jgi:hypothetical protein